MQNGGSNGGDERHLHGVTNFVEERRKLGNHPDLARRLYLAVSSYRAGISYATAEKRLIEDSVTDTRERIDPSWGIVADKLMSAVSEAVSERLMSLFG